MRSAWAIAAVLAALTALATSARAAPERVARLSWELADGPTLAGSAIAWREQLCLEACGPEEVDCNQVYRYRVRIAPPPRRRDLLTGETACANSGPSYSNSDVRFAVSAGRMLLAKSSSWGDEFDEGSGTELLAGPLGGPLERLTACRADYLEGASANSVHALDGDLAAFDPTPCDTTPDLEVRNLADRSARSIPLEGTAEIRELAVAGTLVAAMRGEMVEVYDAHGGARVYSAKLPGKHPFGMQLAPDGRIAASFAPGRGDPCQPASVWLARPEEPDGRVMPIRACSEVRLVDAGLVYLAPGRRHQPAAMKLLGLDGRAERIIVRFPNDVSAAAAFDARGGLAAYGLRGCQGTVDLYRVAIGGPASVAESPPCAARMLGRALISYPGGRLRVPVRCPNGCAGEIVARHAAKVLGARPFSVAPAPGPSGIVLRLRRRGRMLLRRTRHLEFVVELEIAGSRAGRTRTIRRRLTPRPVSELPGGRSSESVFLVDPVVRSLGRRAAGVCFEIGYYTSEVDGAAWQVYGEGGEFDRCRKRSRPLRVPSGGQISVRTPREASGVALEATTGDSHACPRRRAGAWRCGLPSGEAGRRLLNLTVRYPGAEARFKLVLSFTSRRSPATQAASELAGRFLL